MCKGVACVYECVPVLVRIHLLPGSRLWGFASLLSASVRVTLKGQSSVGPDCSINTPLASQLHSHLCVSAL